MKQFLSIALRNQFNLFYRFGYTFIPKSQLVEFDDKINDKTQENIIKQFKTVTPFEYDEEYLILHLEKALNYESEFVQFEINEIVAVYPLSQQAKTSIESKIDRRIRLEKPIFETILPTIETEIEKKEVEKAITALWTICKIENQLENYIANIKLENIFIGLEYRKHGTKANKIINGNYWEYLIAYDRFDYFPNSTLGYFYDAGQVFAYSKGHSTFEGSGIHKFLEKLNSANPTVKLPDIIKYLETEEQIKGYVSQTTIGDIKQYIVAPLFLMFRDEIRKSDDISQTKLFNNLGYLKSKSFGDSFNYAVILLGAFFGFRKFYDNYYDVLNLRIYKSYKPQIIGVDTAVEQHQEQFIADLNDKNQEPMYTIEEPVLLVNLKKSEEVPNEKHSQESIIKEHLTQGQIRTTQDDSEAESIGIMSPYLRIIEDLLSKQAEVKLTEIKNRIIKECNETKSVDEIKDLIIKLKIEVESVKGKTNTIKKLNFKS